jgi:hypothetical protein
MMLHEPGKCDVCEHGYRKRRREIVMMLWPWVLVLFFVTMLALLEGITR